MDVENGQEGGVSERKREANRKNAKKSTGPRSHAGKERSKGNATTHGLSAQALLITVGELKEDPEERREGMALQYEAKGVDRSTARRMAEDYLNVYRRLIASQRPLRQAI